MELEAFAYHSNGMGLFEGVEDSSFSCSFGTSFLPEKFQEIDFTLQGRTQNPRPCTEFRGPKDFFVFPFCKRSQEEEEIDSILETHVRKLGSMTSNGTGNEDFLMWTSEFKIALGKCNESSRNSDHIRAEDDGSYGLCDLSDTSGRKRKIWELNGHSKEVNSHETEPNRKHPKKLANGEEENLSNRSKEAAGSKMPPWHVDVIEDMTADLDGSLSNLGADLAAGSYNMSEALLSLPSLTVFKQEAPSPSQENLIHAPTLQQNVEETQDQNSTLHRLLQQSNFHNNLKRINSGNQTKASDVNEKKSEDCRFQYVLAAATSIATKVTEETLTYLNQGQSYEIKLKKVGELSNFRGKILKHVAGFWDELEDTDTYDLVSDGIRYVKEILDYFNQWIRCEEFDSREIVEITQSLTMRVVWFAYNAVAWLMQYTCAFIVYIFSTVDSVNEAIEFMRPAKATSLFKTFTGLIVYEKPISFDYNPFHWVVKVAKIVLLAIKSRIVIQETEESCLGIVKILIICILALLACRSYWRNKKPRPPQKEEKEREDNTRDPTIYEGHIKWEAGLVRTGQGNPGDLLNVKIFVNSNICPENQGRRYDESVATSTASICRIVSDVLSSSPIESREVTVESNEDLSGVEVPRLDH